MRGKVKQDDSTLCRRRITPAYAGKRMEWRQKKRCLGDHPRLCGEKWRQRWRKGSSTGSPPPMRGKAVPRRQNETVIGITPAYAGKSCYAEMLYNFGKDHPRLCGEKVFQSITQHSELGSPPPMRGKVRRCQQPAFAVRITPAYAGKSLGISKGALSQLGSPPPMRGKAAAISTFASGVGITPAYAGKRLRLYKCGYDVKDHPRLCGEKPVCKAVSTTRLWITPAYAGKSRPLPPPVPSDRDHPRLCGEKTKKIPKQRYFFHQPASFSFSLQYT